MVCFKEAFALNIHKIAVLGDSISEGLGSKKINFISDLKESVPDADIRNFARGATTIRYAMKILPEVQAYDPDIVVVFYGNVDAALRPDIYEKNKRLKFFPKRYRDFWMLDPRPFFSHYPLKRALQKLESSCRVKIKKMLMKWKGARPMVSLDEFSIIYENFVHKIFRADRQILLVSTVTIDDFYFPGSARQYEAYNRAMEKISDSNHLHFVDLYHVLARYPFDEVCNYDHFHPNATGYRVIAKVLAGEIHHCENLPAK